MYFTLRRDPCGKRSRVARVARVAGVAGVAGEFPNQVARGDGDCPFHCVFRLPGLIPFPAAQLVPLTPQDGSQRKSGNGDG